MKLIKCNCICLAIFVIASISVSTAQLAVNKDDTINGNRNARVQQCHQIGEYCQNHWDCCSNTCLSYAYKCVRGYAELHPLPPLTQNEVMAVQTLESVDELVNRFGSDDDDRRTSNTNTVQRKEIPTLNCSPRGFRCVNHSNCCSSECNGIYCS